jgi:hypothetical protein
MHEKAFNQLYLPWPIPEIAFFLFVSDFAAAKKRKGGLLLSSPVSKNLHFIKYIWSIQSGLMHKPEV